MAEAATRMMQTSLQSSLADRTHLHILHLLQRTLRLHRLSAYDQGCVELIQNSFSDYFQGNVDFDKAKANFETAIKERYPEISQR